MEYLDLVDHVSEISLRLFMYMLFLWIDSQHPFIRHIDEDEMWMYKYPAVPPIIPKNLLFVLIILIPSVIFSVEYALKGRKEDIIKGVYGITLAYALNAILTVVLKLFVGRPRPNFFMRCFPDGYGVDINNCTGEYGGHMDGRKSFPSAHTTFAFTGMFFMTLRMYTLLKIHERNRGQGWRCVLCVLPLVIAVLIGISRTCDYNHHYTDVLFGSAMGSCIAYCTYYVYFPERDQPLDNKQTTL
ncbi:phospholipid phosphatase 5 [Sitophilus oryzae]|uniref:Phospholipid phosphatase 5 n=1 Tax=Sitophilus oryzae TaxID=7048 RepID=A0A6J2XA97_SITOR|nr:phospholipid phosphatase 5 [Sitophilus oryzae]